MLVATTQYIEIILIYFIRKTGEVLILMLANFQLNYLVISANLAAGYLGIKNRIKPTQETKKSVFGQKKSSLPKNMEEGIFLFEKDEQLNEVFNQKFVRTIAAIRRVENQAYLKVISSWEREYLLLNV